jgi:hypothetical protein
MPRDQYLVINLAVAGPVRVAVGPAAWFVLEALAADAPPGVRTVRFRGGTRAVAGRVRRSKDAVARALRVLAEAGVVERVEHRDELSGRFDVAEYVVDLAAAGLAVTDAVSPRTATATADTVSPHTATADAVSPYTDTAGVPVPVVPPRPVPEVFGHQLSLLT